MSPKAPAPRRAATTGNDLRPRTAAARPQAGILAAPPALGRYLVFDMASDDAGALRNALQALADRVDGKASVLGLGLELVTALGAQIPGLRAFPELPLPGSKGKTLGTAQPALWCWLRSGDAEDLGHLVRRTQWIEACLAPAYKLRQVVDGFCHARPPAGHGRDLSGYEDGTENPSGRKARQVALVSGAGTGLDGSSFVAVQQWVHDFAALERMSPLQRDHMIGRRQSDNEELDDAPPSAHVKRTAQESFSPEAFVVRRSMPWAQGRQAGLMFVAFGRTLDAFEAQMRRMVGLDDGIVDALFGLSKPAHSAYYWCPPCHGRRLDLRALAPREGRQLA